MSSNRFEIERIFTRLNEKGLAETKPVPPTPLNNVTEAILMFSDSGEVRAHAAWRLLDNHGRIVGYLKYGTEEEIARTKKADEDITKNNLLEKFNLINIEYSKIIAEDTKDLPANIVQQIEEEFNRIKHLIRESETRTNKIFIVSPVDTRGFCWGNLDKDEKGIETAFNAIHRIKIRSDEWEQIVNFFQQIGHDDISNNLYFRRDLRNKLNIGIIDFEPVKGSLANPTLELQKLGNMLNSKGLKEPSYLDNRIDQYYEDEFLYF